MSGYMQFLCEVRINGQGNVMPRVIAKPKRSQRIDVGEGFKLPPLASTKELNRTRLLRVRKGVEP